MWFGSANHLSVVQIWCGGVISVAKFRCDLRGRSLCYHYRVLYVHFIVFKFAICCQMSLGRINILVNFISFAMLGSVSMLAEDITGTINTQLITVCFANTIK